MENYRERKVYMFEGKIYTIPQDESELDEHYTFRVNWIIRHYKDGTNNIDKLIKESRLKCNEHFYGCEY